MHVRATRGTVAAAVTAAAVGVGVLIGVGGFPGVAGVHLGGGPSGPRSRVITLGADGAIAFVPVSGRAAAVNLAGATLVGGRADVAAFRGAPVVLNIWESSCTPCRSEAADLQAAYAELKPSGVGFIGIDHRGDDPAQARAFQRTFGITYPSIADVDGQALLALRGAAPPTATPTTLVLDAEGRVAARVTGPVDRTTLIGLVADIRTGRTPAP
jgi:thiol-disulfide isomerase/thioredoxin